MKTHEIIVSGFGGQGVMVIGKTLAEAAMKENMNVSWLPSYGPEMRGGTANCSVILSSKSIVSPVISEPNIVIAMNEPSLIKFEKDMVKDGIIFINSSVVKVENSRDDIRAIYVPTYEIATDLGNARVANMVMLGAYIEATKFLNVSTIEDMLKRIFIGEKAKLVELNIKALQKGANCVNGG